MVDLYNRFDASNALFSGGPISDGWLKKLKMETTLVTKTANLSPIVVLTNTRYLTIIRREIVDISPLVALPKLSVLFMVTNEYFESVVFETPMNTRMNYTLNMAKRIK